MAGIVAAVALPLVLAAAALLLWPRSPTAVSEEDALARYRSEGGASPGPAAESPIGMKLAQAVFDATVLPGTAGPAGTDAAVEEAAGVAAGGRTEGPAQTAGPEGTARPTAVRPAGGVYVFSASGSERVSLGPASDTRPYGATVTATVRNDGNCWTFRQALFAEHSETTRYCLDGDGSLHATGHSKTQRIGPITAQAEMSCSPDLVLGGSPASSLSWQSNCNMATTTPLFTASIRQNGTIADLGAESVDVGGSAVTARHVRIRRDVSGDMTGFWHEDLWFASGDNTIVRIERNAELRGPASFSENATIVLTSMTPRS